MGLTWVRDETTCSLGRLRALASCGGAVKRAKRERVVEVIEGGAEEGLNWVVDAVLLERERDRRGGGGSG